MCSQISGFFSPLTVNAYFQTNILMNTFPQLSLNLCIMVCRPLAYTDILARLPLPTFFLKYHGISVVILGHNSRNLHQPKHWVLETLFSLGLQFQQLKFLLSSLWVWSCNVKCLIIYRTLNMRHMITYLTKDSKLNSKKKNLKMGKKT